MPSFLTLNKATSTFSLYTMRTTAIGNYTITLGALDNTGLVATSVTFTIEVYTSFINNVTPTYVIGYNKTNTAPYYKSVTQNLIVNGGVVTAFNLPEPYDNNTFDEISATVSIYTYN